jgi:outer membrane protein assembly factor BamB
LTEVAILAPAAGHVEDHCGKSIGVTSRQIFAGSYRHNVDGAVFGFDLETNLETGSVGGPHAHNSMQQGYGYDLATSGTRLAVGSFASDGNFEGAGLVHLFDTTTGLETYELKATPGAFAQYMGFSVDLNGSHVVAGAPGWPFGLLAPGSSYLFDATTGQQLFELAASDSSNDDAFGFAVAIENNHVLVGAPKAGGPASNTGAAYLFDTATGQELRRLNASDGSYSDKFGTDVALANGVAYVSAPEHYVASQNTTGAIYVFDVQTGAQLGKITPESLDGMHVSTLTPNFIVEGNRLLTMGRLQNQSFNQEDVVFVYDALNLERLATLRRSDPAGSISFGLGLALRDDVALVGCQENNGGQQFSGSVYRFDLSSLDIPGAAFCFGDGSGTPCPCADSTNPDSGCANSVGQGARLQAAGQASIQNDTLRLHVEGATPSMPGMLLVGANQVNAGLGLPLGSGLLCTTGQSSRSQIQITSPTGSDSFDNFAGQPFGSTSYGLGLPTNYQYWYRDAQSVCSSSIEFNMSNAWSLVWLP